MGTLSIKPRLGLAILLVAGWALNAAPASAYTPESPEVQELLKKAVGYLAVQRQANHGPGADALISLAIYKASGSVTHPRIQEAVANARTFAQESPKNGVGNSIYGATICCLLMLEIDAEKYRPECQLLIDGLAKRQHRNGSWGYEAAGFDDTSQTQYGLLAMWYGQQNGVRVSADSVERAVTWIMATQHAEGGWSYQTQVKVGDDPPGAVANPAYLNVTHSMSAAGAGSLYVGAHLFGIAMPKKSEAGLPPALTRVDQEKKSNAAAFRPQNLNPQVLLKVIAGVNGWFQKNFTYDVGYFTHYYMYGVERYKSFQELAEGVIPPEPDWYNKGVEFLKKTQQADGSWRSPQSPTCEPVIDTAFATLFLTRSSQKSIKKLVLDEGTLVGGKGLPKSIQNVRLQDGKVVSPQMVRDVDDLLKLLEKADKTEFDPNSLPGKLSLDADLTKRTSQLQRLRDLVSAEKFEARLAAVKTLAKAANLDNVPVLIYALGDPDWPVVQEAREGLRFISRRFEGFGPPPNATREQIRDAQTKWKQWYLSLRPDAEVLE